MAAGVKCLREGTCTLPLENIKGLSDGSDCEGLDFSPTAVVPSFWSCVRSCRRQCVRCTRWHESRWPGSLAATNMYLYYVDEGASGQRLSKPKSLEEPRGRWGAGRANVTLCVSRPKNYKLCEARPGAIHSSARSAVTRPNMQP